ncbi:EcsC family protein [Atopobium fossor]|uniref:EcsC family protein n=1 Tax=Atopobium fossor TaxID=39487 RepID=UPI0004144CB2|nr:EcsC family protein [Atopobium fossor]
MTDDYSGSAANMQQGGDFTDKSTLDEQEIIQLKKLDARYKKVSSNKLAQAGKKVLDLVPTQAKAAVAAAGATITEQQLYNQAMELIAKGFTIAEKNAAKYTVSKEAIVKSINATSDETQINSFEEICTLPSSIISKAAHKGNIQHALSALAEGAATGLFGFAGVPANLATSTFVYYRAVQCIAMSYGFDIQDDPAELIIAGEVLSSSMNPLSSSNNGQVNTVSKFMTLAFVSNVEVVAKKGWVAMAQHGGSALLLVQMRALANKAAQKALVTAGKQGLEKTALKEVFEQIGKRLTLKTIQRAVPVVGAGIGALIDYAQMNAIIEYADIFYHRRFIIEKEQRIKELHA